MNKALMDGLKNKKYLLKFQQKKLSLIQMSPEEFHMMELKMIMAAGKQDKKMKYGCMDPNSLERELELVKQSGDAGFLQ